MTTFIGKIRAARQWVLWVLFFAFPTIFLLIALGFAVIWWIRFSRWWVWQWPLSQWVTRYLLFLRLLFAFWRFCWKCLWFGVWRFCTNRSQVQMWYFCVCRVRTNRSRTQRWSTHRNVLALKFLIFFPNVKLSFIVIVIARLYLTHSYCCRFTKKTTRRDPMGSIHRPLDSGSGSTEATAFIQCVDGR